MKMSKKLRKMPKRRNKNNVAETEMPSLFGATKTGTMMIGVPTSLVTIGKDLGHLKEAKNVDTSTVQAGMIIGEQMTETDISLVDRDQGTEATVEDPAEAATGMKMTIKLN